MRKFKNKDYINTLLSIDNVFGEYDGKMMPIILTILLTGAPSLIWLFFLQATPIKLTYVLIFSIPWGLYWALYFIGNTPQKKYFYLEQRNDKTSDTEEIVHIKLISDDGLIQYDTGKVAYIVSGYLRTYLTDDKLSTDLEHFMDELDMWSWDYYLHNTIDELLCENELPKVGRYSDKQVIQDRVGFYAFQDEWSRTHSGLYRISFLVSCASYDWKKLRSNLEELIESDLASCFNEISILDYDGVIDICSRDICAFVDLRKMLLKKYDNESYFDSKVLWYDDDVPEDLIPEKENSSLEERRQ